jgi:rhodanese-related sulfurtransferase
MSQPTIVPAEAAAALHSGQGILVDVRTPAEFEEIHAEGAQLVSLDVLNRAAVETVRGRHPGPVYLLCASGIRATKAAGILQAAGLENVFVVAGGTNAWVAAGLPVVRGRKTISIERQVRIGAGTLVVTGFVLGWWVQRDFFILSGLVGAGLIFAGVTDICGLGILLAKAPWNRTKGNAAGAPPTVPVSASSS